MRVASRNRWTVSLRPMSEERRTIAWPSETFRLRKFGWSESTHEAVNEVRHRDQLESERVGVWKIQDRHQLARLKL